MRFDWKAVAGLLVSAVLIWWVLRGVEIDRVWQVIKGARWGLLVGSVILATSGFLVRAVRWRLLLHPLKPDTGLHNRFAAVNIGFGLNNVLPARMGELARAWSISRLEGISATGALGSLVVERVLDFVVLIMLIEFAVLLPSFPVGATIGGRPLGSLITIFVVLFIGFLVGLILLARSPDLFLRVVERASGWLPEAAGEFVAGASRRFVAGLLALRDPRLFLGAAAWTVAFWLWNGLSFWLAMAAFDVDLGYGAALFVQGVIALGIAVPSAPGFFGTFHAAAVVGLSEVYGVSQNSTLAFAFAYHLGAFIPVTAIGLWYATRLGLSLGEVGSLEQASDPGNRAELGASPE